MRMWMVRPLLMCGQHIGGEHVELHMFIGTLRAGKSIQGYVDNGLIEPSSIESRHDELVKEMKRRGWNHDSPLEFDFDLPDRFLNVEVDAKESLRELVSRCDECRNRVERFSVEPREINNV